MLPSEMTVLIPDYVQQFLTLPPRSGMTTK